MTNKAIRLLFATFVAVFTLTAASCGGNVFEPLKEKDERSSLPDFVIGDDGEPLWFTLDLRERSASSSREENDGFSHSDVDGALIRSWTIPYYGNTVFESVFEFFKNSESEKITFYSRGNYYYFKNCVLADGTEYDLQTAYISSDGKYAKTANYEKLAGNDGVFGTSDDLKILTIVYRGWL
ncbi:MAG: hypothetical protein IJ800_06590 [Clostridia bacterium]|nr:hypothetical protein [Clostridia bacterium]